MKWLADVGGCLKTTSLANINDKSLQTYCIRGVSDSKFSNRTPSPFYLLASPADSVPMQINVIVLVSDLLQFDAKKRESPSLL